MWQSCKQGVPGPILKELRECSTERLEARPLFLSVRLTTHKVKVERYKSHQKGATVLEPFVAKLYWDVC